MGKNQQLHTAYRIASGRGSAGLYLETSMKENEGNKKDFPAKMPETEALPVNSQRRAQTVAVLFANRAIVPAMTRRGDGLPAKSGSGHRRFFPYLDRRDVGNTRPQQGQSDESCIADVRHLVINKTFQNVGFAKRLPLFTFDGDRMSHAANRFDFNDSAVYAGG